jgi:hypothetical protein
MEFAGRKNLQGKPMSTIVGDTFEALIEANMRLYKLQRMTDAVAEQFLGLYLPKLPGFEAGDFVGVLEEQAAEPAAQVIEGTKIEWPTRLDDYEVKSEDFRLQAVVDKSRSVEEVLDQTADAIKAAEDQELVAALSASSIERVTPETPTPKATVAPWETSLAPLEAVEEDDLYQEALAMNELMALAVRAVYWGLSKTYWSTDEAVKLVQQVYKSFKKYKEIYEKA